MSKIWKTYKSSFILLAAMVIGGLVGMFWGEGAEVLQPERTGHVHCRGFSEAVL